MKKSYDEKHDRENKRWIDNFARRKKNNTDTVFYLSNFKDDEFE